MIDLLLGPCVRKLALGPQDNSVFLTFDDGPHPDWTPRVLDVLESHDALATFFVVGSRAQALPDLTRRLLREGHSVGDHSWDHRFQPFFASQTNLENWIVQGRERLSELLGEAPCAFRSPAGVRTPPLRRVLDKLQLPLVLWNHRFYDAVWTWKESKALRCARRLNAGDIVLLHDAQKASQGEPFLATLDAFLKAVRSRGLSPKALPKMTVTR